MRLGRDAHQRMDWLVNFLRMWYTTEELGAKGILSGAQSGQIDLVRQLITEAQMEAQLFPLARAIDDLQSGDEALIEKLSPEVKGIVEEVGAKLRPSGKGKKEGRSKQEKRQKG